MQGQIQNRHSDKLIRDKIAQLLGKPSPTFQFGEGKKEGRREKPRGPSTNQSGVALPSQPSRADASRGRPRRALVLARGAAHHSSSPHSKRGSEDISVASQWWHEEEIK